MHDDDNATDDKSDKAVQLSILISFGGALFIIRLSHLRRKKIRTGYPMVEKASRAL